MKQQKRFFTLIEILTVAAIIAILAGISVGAIALISNKNAEAKTKATIKALEMALSQYKTDNGFVYLPPKGASLKTPSLLTIPKLSSLPESSGVKGTLLKYLDQKLLNSATKEYTDDKYLYFVDAWDRPLIYQVPGKFNTSGFDLGSAGPDGKVGDAEVTASSLPSASDYTGYFGQGDDITNFLRN